MSCGAQMSKRTRTDTARAHGLALAAHRLPQDCERHALSFLDLCDLGALVYTARGLQRLVYSFIAGLTSVTVPEFEYGEAVSELRATCLNAALGVVRLHAKIVHSLFSGDALTKMQPPSL
jgi:hypothetical protein